MKRFLKKLFFANISKSEDLPNEVIQKRISNLKDIWNNKYHNDSGIEKLLRLILAFSQFLFPGIYIKEAFKRYGGLVQELVTEVFVICKTIYPVLLMYLGWNSNTLLYYIAIWLMLETIFYIPTLIFASDSFKNPRSIKRSMILLFFNYLEITFSFALIYSNGNYLDQPFAEWYDPIYYSFVVTSTVGFGNYHPATGFAKFLFCTQSMFYLSFIILFINFFSQKIKTRGYFGKNED